MTETIHIKLGEMRVEKNKGVFKAPENGRKTYTKDQFDVIATTSDGYKYVGLKAYDLDSFRPKDKEIIRSHNTKKTDNGVEYYTFNRGRTFEEIKEKKNQMIKEIEEDAIFPVDEIKKDDTIFGSVVITFNIPKFMIKKQKIDEMISWHCWDDLWTEHDEDNQDRRFLEFLYKNKGKLKGECPCEKTNN